MSIENKKQKEAPLSVARNEVVNLRQAIKSMVNVQSHIILSLHELEAALTKKFKNFDGPFFLSHFEGGVKHLTCVKAGIRWNLCGKSCPQSIKGIYIYTCS